jgi:hypothetical protein
LCQRFKSAQARAPNGALMSRTCSASQSKSRDTVESRSRTVSLRNILSPRGPDSDPSPPKGTCPECHRPDPLVEAGVPCPDRLCGRRLRQLAVGTEAQVMQRIDLCRPQRLTNTSLPAQHKMSVQCLITIAWNSDYLSPGIRDQHRLERLITIPERAVG